MKSGLLRFSSYDGCYHCQDEYYYDVKRAAETSLGIMTQCVTRDVARRKDRMTNVNLSFKINEKLGGINTVLSAGALNVRLDPAIPT